MAFVAQAVPFAQGKQRGVNSNISGNNAIRVGNDGRRRPARMVVGEAVAPSAEIVAGSVALAIPFFVAAVLFGERIYRQRTCAKCGGSGLVSFQPGSKILVRCKKCGGFLPWLSFRRFFTG